jgi:hypothetical protein
MVSMNLLFIFLVFLVLTLPLGTTAVAQRQTQFPHDPAPRDLPTPEEERILKLASLLRKKDVSPEMNKKYWDEFDKLHSHYLREEYKKCISGKWVFFDYNDEIIITYDDKNKVFLGQVSKIVKMDRSRIKVGDLLFRVYFPKDFMQGTGWVVTTYGADIDIAWLRDNRCSQADLKGQEFSYDNKGKRTVEDLTLTVSHGGLLYKQMKGNVVQWFAPLRRVK